MKTQDGMVQAIVKELTDRKAFTNEEIQTIYFGGGTPSLLHSNQIEQILGTVYQLYNVSAQAEITLEANPEDLSIDKSKELFDLGINRLSIGIQTFDDAKLSWMNRAHNSQEAMRAFEHARSAGFGNISLDLIYAIPELDRKLWEHDLKRIVGMQPEHISLYGLTIEEKTVFGKWEQAHKLIQVPEDEAAQQYLYAIDYLKTEGYIQYEVSNFGKEGFHSRHNHAYWMGVPYLGIGPGAHSFDGFSRRFNVRNNPQYIKAIQAGTSYYENESLSETQRVNEQILTRLRTKQGLHLETINQSIEEDFLSLHFAFIEELKQQDLIQIEGGYLSLNSNGFLVADEIALRLFLPE